MKAEQFSTAQLREIQSELNDGDINPAIIDRNIIRALMLRGIRAEIDSRSSLHKSSVGNNTFDLRTYH